MLELLSAGLVSGWLQMAGLPPSLDPWESLSQANLPATFWPQTSDPSAEKMIAQYLKLLKSQGLEESNQGVWLQSGTTLLGDHRSIVPMPAASLTKVATSLAALQTWDINHQFETTIATTGTVKNGVLHGDLILQDGGDPLFVWEDAVAVGNALNKLGIDRVAGDLVIAGKFMMNFETEPERSSDLIKKAWNPKADDEDSRAEWAALPDKTRRPTIAISGKVRSAAPNIPNQTVLMRHRSLPLIHLIKYLNVHSQNEMAQSFADQLGGTQAVMQKAAAASGISPDELQLVNGSGLGMKNRISPHAVCAMFAAIERQVHPLNLTIGDLFPVAGVDGGTLEDRSTPNWSVVKTGTLNEVSALAGVVPTRDRGLVWFAVINRGSNISELRKQQDLFLQSLQKAWGTIEAVPMIEPSAWTAPQRERFDAQTRNEVSISEAISAKQS